MSGDKPYKKGLVSFCCLSYNHGAFIKECIESIWNQDYKNIEIIALDDGSTDQSTNIIANLAKKSPVPMETIFQENSGNVPKNFNTMIKKANGEFIFFISLDDTVLQDCVSSKIKFFEQDDNLVFAANKFTNRIDKNSKIIKEDFKPSFWEKEKYTTPQDLLDIEHKYLETFFIQGALFKKSTIDEIGGFDDDLIGDDIVLRTKLFFHMKNNKELTFKLLDSSGVKYRIHGNNIHMQSTRQIKLVKQWKDIFFPDRDYPQIMIVWIEHAFNESARSGNTSNLKELIAILHDITKDKDLENRKKLLAKILYHQVNVKKLGIPFLFEFTKIKTNNKNEKYIRLLGFKIISLNKTLNGRELKILGINFNTYAKY